LIKGEELLTQQYIEDYKKAPFSGITRARNDINYGPLLNYGAEERIRKRRSKNSKLL
jgi:hypothetical protein